jgi:hypothetical protein
VRATGKPGRRRGANPLSQETCTRDEIVEFILGGRKIMKKKLIFAASIVLVVGLFIGAYFLWVAPKPLGAGEKTVTLEITAQDKSYSHTIKTNGGTAFDALGAIKDEIGFRYTDAGWGIWVDGFYGAYYSSTNTDCLYWAFFINGEASVLGISAEPIADGDTISFILADWNEPLEYAGVPDNAWIFYEIAALVFCMGLMAYMIVGRPNEY